MLPRRLEMSESEDKWLNEEHYHQVSEIIRCEAANLFKNLDLTRDLFNSFLLSMLQRDEVDGGIPALVRNMFPRLVEEVFASYQKSILQYCLIKTHDPDLAHEIAQESILQLLAAQNPILDTHTWLKQVAHNLLCKYYKTQDRNRTIYRKLSVEASVIQDMVQNSRDPLSDGVFRQLPDQIYTSPEYKEYQQMLGYAGISEYAEASHISYNAAQKRKAKIIRDLKARVLLALGWEASPEILNYNQFIALQKFLRELLSLGQRGKPTRPLSSSRQMEAKILELMRQFPRIDDWGIALAGTRQYRLHIFHLTLERKPVFATFLISMSLRHRVWVADCKLNVPAGVHQIPANVQIPKDKGKSLWTYERVISLLM